jgi:hypothetical protein
MTRGPPGGPPAFGYALDENDKTEIESHADSTVCMIDDINDTIHDEKEGKEGIAGMDEEVQEVMKDNLELMLDVVMKIREDEEFARNIYANCPRLQDLLEHHPDLKPVFEDPHFVRINFEEVYRNAGGALPEDKPKKVSCYNKVVTPCLSKVVNHPLFKVLRFFILIKKMVSCVMGGGFAMIKGCFCGLCFDEAADNIGDMDGDGGDGDHESSPQNQANREQLNKAADHMEEPEVQERMNELLESNDPDELAEAVEKDPELKALRDSNPLCAELMAEPETMRILVDPDNLRALGECPDLIEQDFSNPDWSSPDIEVGEPEIDGVDVDADADADANPEEGEEEEAYDEEAAEEGEAEDGMIDDFEMEEQDGNKSNAATKSKSKSKDKKQKKEGGGGGGMLSSLGAGITDMVAGELIGVTMGELTGGGDDLGGLEEVEDIPTDDLADAAEGAGAAASDTANGLAATSEILMSDETFDNLDNLEDGLDEIEDTHDDRAAGAGTDGDADKGDSGKGENRNASRAKAGAIGAAGGLAVHTAMPGGRSRGADGEPKEGKTLDDDKTLYDDQEGEEEEEKSKKSRFGFVGNMVSSLATAAKEHVASAVLGDDFGEMLVEKQEEDKEEDDDKEENREDGDKEDETEEDKKKRIEDEEAKKQAKKEPKKKKSRRKMFPRKI